MQPRIGLNHEASQLDGSGKIIKYSKKYCGIFYIWMLIVEIVKYSKNIDTNVRTISNIYQVAVFVIIQRKLI